MTAAPDRPSLRERLRALPVLGAGLPGLDVDAAPDKPGTLFVDWLLEAIDAGLPAPHAATLSTADASGRVDARTLILKDVDGDGWVFATRADSPKGLALAENPNAALTFFWREHGRQVRVRGPVVPLGPDASAADFLARSDASRATALAGPQSDPLASQDAYRTAWDAALARVRSEPGLVLDAWTAYALEPTSVEFWASSPEGQTRLRYAAAADTRTAAPTWTKELLWP
ncbi:pyridoxine/pyridoxamine 5'-phosphate oxidase [Cellulosimicrobium cellulans]|uniref:pyridoxine/pyridoxamine 5'-phosphate oxidase n=1 Tax=Cellulosimicrobium cellulans TaxID=1710 RepID=UPI0020980142|nr:pyridoxal 5'-phosphate synthase [Cellulosimicrobium cellulans]MCO7272349.1 pyridoxal 5'-phosphate synthase [Cellulosimicrobium cellulans]